MNPVKPLRLMLSALLLLLGIVWLSSLFTHHQAGDNSLRLQAPPFIKVAKAQGANFDGAGIAAYFKTSRTIDLKQVKTVMRHVEEETDQFIIGGIGIKDYNENWDAKVYANVDGWVIVYYSRTTPTSALVDWLHYRYGSVPLTTLEQALNTIAETQSFTPPAPSYYHFNFPNATDITIVLDVCTVGSDCPNLFDITLPDSFDYSETSWSLAGKGALNDSIQLFIDDATQPHGAVSAWSDTWIIGYGNIFPTLSAGFKHSFHIRSYYGRSGYDGAGAIVIVYNKGA